MRRQARSQARKSTFQIMLALPIRVCQLRIVGQGTFPLTTTLQTLLRLDCGHQLTP